MNKKLSVKEILEINEAYKKRKQELDELYRETRELNSRIDLNEVKETLNYEEVKSLYTTLIYATSSKQVESDLRDILQKKKIEKYPQILDVHYYPELQEIDFLDKEEKIALDKLLKDAHKSTRYLYKIYDLDKKTLDFLLSKEILEKKYSFSCHCGSDECYTEFITEKQKEAFYEYHNFDYKNATDEEIEEHEENFHLGYFSVGCWNDGAYEVESIEKFEANVHDMAQYRVIKKPDMSLDNL